MKRGVHTFLQRLSRKLLVITEYMLFKWDLHHDEILIVPSPRGWSQFQGLFGRRNKQKDDYERMRQNNLLKENKKEKLYSPLTRGCSPIPRLCLVGEIKHKDDYEGMR